MPYVSLLEDDGTNMQPEKAPVKKKQTGYVSLLEDEESVQQPNVPKPALVSDPYAGLNPIEKLAVGVAENPVTNAIANTTKDITASALRTGGAVLSGTSAINRINPIGTDDGLVADVLNKSGNFLTDLSKNKYLKTPETAITEQINQGNLGGAVQAIKQNPAEIMPTVAKYTFQNLAPAVAAGMTGGVSLVPEMTGYSFDRLVSEKGVAPEKAALIATGEGIINAGLENVMGAVPVFRKLLNNEVSQEVAKQEIKSLLKRGLSVVGGTAKTSAEESFEEAAQQIVSNFSNNIAGVPTDILEGVPESAAGGFLGGLGLGAFGHTGVQLSEMEQEETPLEKLPRAQYQPEKAQAMNISDINPDAFRPMLSANPMDTVLEGQEYAGLEESEKIRQRLQQEQDDVQFFQSERQNILNKIGENYGDVANLRKTLTETDDAQGVQLLKDLVSVEKELASYNALNDVYSSQLPSRENTPDQPGQLRPAQAGGFSLSGGVQENVYNPDEGVEYVPDTQELKRIAGEKAKQKNKQVSSELNLLAEIAREHNTYGEFKNAITEELKDSGFTLGDVTEEVKKYGFNGLRNFFANRDNVEAIPAELPDVTPAKYEGSKNVPSVGGNTVDAVAGKDTVIDETAQRGEEIEEIVSNPYSDVIPDKEMLNLVNNAQVSDQDIEKIAQDRRKEKIKVQTGNETDFITKLEEETSAGTEQEPVIETIPTNKLPAVNKNEAATELQPEQAGVAQPEAGREGVEYYRYSDSKNPMSKYGHAMFVDNPDTSAHYGKNKYVFKATKENSVKIEDLEEKIRESYRDYKEEGDIAGYLPQEEYYFTNLTEDEFVEAFNPQEIVDSANAYDSPELNQWIWDKVLEPNNIKAITTRNGAIVYDEGLIKEANEPNSTQAAPTTKENQVVENQPATKNRYKIKGKMYDVVQDMPVLDTDIVEFKREIKDTKGNSFILVKNKLTKDYTLYKDNKRQFTFNSLNEKPVNIGYNENKNEGIEDDNVRTSQEGTGDTTAEALSDTDTTLPQISERDGGTDTETSPEYEAGDGRPARLDAGDNGIRLQHKQLINAPYKNNKARNLAIKDFVDGKEYLPYGEEIPQELKDWLSLYDGFGGIHEVEGAGSLTEYYTDDRITKKMWDIVSQYVNPKEVFEPSMGVGRFFKNAPEGINLSGIEMDNTSGTIAQIVYPSANVRIGKFQDLFLNEIQREAGVVKEPIPDNQNPNIGKYDVVIGNPPYGDYKRTDGEMFVKENKNKAGRIEDYFIDRGLDLLQENGVLVYLVQDSFLKSGHSKIKDIIAGKADLVAAYKLPAGVFDRTKKLITDIVVLRKTNSSSGNAGLLSEGKYFAENPDNVLGEYSERKGRFGNIEQVVKGDLEEGLNKVDTSKKDVKKTVKKEVKKAETQSEKPKDKAGQKRTEIGQEEKPAVNYETYIPDNSSYSIDEMNVWSSTKVDGTSSLRIPQGTMSEHLNLYDGKTYNNFNYFQGDIYEKLDQLEKDKKDISPEQYEKQKKGLLAALPEKLDMDKIELTSTSPFILKYNVGEKSIIQAFVRDFLYREVTADDLEEMSRAEIEYYIKGKGVKEYPVSAPHKDDPTHIKKQKTAERDAYANKRQLIGDKLFNRYLRTKIPVELQNTIVEDYNKTFNGEALPDYNKIPLFVKNISKTFKGRPFNMYDVQREGAGFFTIKGTGLIGFEVGVGKTITGIVAMQQAIELGRAKKPLVIVPKSTYENWITEIQELMPNIKIHRLHGLGSKVSFNAKDVKDGDVMLATYEALNHLWYSPEASEKLKNELQKVSKDYKKEETKREKKGSGEEITALFTEAEGKNTKRFDITKLGVDYVMFDEAHKGKNLFSSIRLERETEDGGKQTNKYSKMQLSQQDSTTAKRMFLLSQHVLMNNGNRNVAMLTATPFNNHAVEIFNMLSFVARDDLQRMGLNNVYDFMEMFSDVTYDWVITSTGTIEYRQVLKGFKNLKILRKIINKHILFRTADDAGIQRPDKKQVKAVLAPTSEQEKIFQDIREKLSTGKSKNEELLAMIAMARKATISHLFAEGIDHTNFDYLTDEDLSADEKMKSFSQEFVESSPKLKYICDCIAESLKDDPNTSQIIYSPYAKDYFKYIKNYLANNYDNISMENIATSEEATEKYTLQDMADALNNRQNKLKILIGTSKIKEGMNLNKNSSSLYVLALDWRPTDQIQLEGRIHRQGNIYRKIRVVYPLLKNSADSFMLQKLEEKITRFNNIWESADDYFSMEEIDAEEEKFALVTDPEVKADFSIKKQEAEKRTEAKFLENKLKELPGYVSQYQELNREIVNAGKGAEQVEEKLNKSKEEFAVVKKELEEAEENYKNGKKEYKNEPAVLERLEILLERKKSSFETEKQYIRTLTKEVNEQKRKEQSAIAQKKWFLKRMEDNDIDINNIEIAETRYKEKIKKVEEEKEQLKEKRIELVEKYKKEQIELDKKAKTGRELVNEFKNQNKEFLGESNIKQLPASEKAKYSYKAGRIYVGEVSSWEEIKDRVIKTFNTVKEAIAEFMQFAYRPDKYFIAKANGKAHIVKGNEIRVNIKGKTKSNDIFWRQDMISRIGKIFDKNSHTKTIRENAIEREYDLQDKILEHNSELINLEISMEKNLDNLIDYVEGTKEVPADKVEIVKKIKKNLDTQGSRVLDELINAKFIKPVTKKVGVRDYEVYTPDGQTLIGKAEGEKSIDKIFREYMHKNWKKKDYFPHVFQGLYPVIATKKDGTKEFIGRATTKGDAKRVLKEFFEENGENREEYTGEVTLDTSVDKPVDANEYVLVGLPDLAKIAEKIRDQKEELYEHIYDELAYDQIEQLQNFFRPKRDVRKARVTGHAKHREGYQGYIKDPIEALSKYFYSTEKFIQDSVFLRKSASEIAKAKRKGMMEKQPNLYEAAIRYVEAIVGKKYADDKVMEDITRKFFELIGKPHEVNYGWYPKAAAALRSYETNTKLGFFRLDNILIQPSLLVSTVLPDLTTEYGFNSFSQGVKMTIQTISDKNLQSIASKSHVLDAGFISSMENKVEAFGGIKSNWQLMMSRLKNGNYKKLGKPSIDLLLDMSMLPFMFGDKAPRLVAFWGRFNSLMKEFGYKKIEDMSEEDVQLITEESAKYSDKLNFKYSNTDAPAMFRSNFGKLALQFKQFPVFYLGLMKDFIFEDAGKISRGIQLFRQGNKKQAAKVILSARKFAISALMSYLYFGVAGIPFAKDLLGWLSELLFGRNFLTEAKAANKVNRYGLAGLAGIDISRSGEAGIVDAWLPVDKDFKLNLQWVSPSLGTFTNIIQGAKDAGDSLRGQNNKTFGDVILERSGREVPNIKRAVDGKFGFKTTEKGDENFRKFEYSRINSRKMRELIHSDMNGNKEKADKIFEEIKNSKYYSDINAFKRGYNTIKSNMRSLEFKELKQAYDANKMSKYGRLKSKVIEKFYDGDEEAYIEDFTRYYDNN